MIEAFRLAADEAQSLAWRASLVIVVSSASVPVLIVVSTETNEFLFGRLLPALAGAIAAIAAGGAQIARPQERWRMHRQRQRLLEAEQLSYLHGIGEYANVDKDKLLWERLIAVRRGVVDEWASFVPADTASAIDTLGDRGSPS